MRLSLIFFVYLGYIVSAHKHKHGRDRERDDTLLFSEDVLDLRGSLRREFALETALPEPDKSMLCSPLSVMLPLGKLAFGAEEETQNELLSALGLSAPKQLEQLFSHLIVNMRNIQGVTLDVVSRLYVSSKQNINKRFLNNIKNLFGSSIKKINAKHPSKTVDEINEWVAENTRQQIKNFFSEGEITGSTSLVLVNAIFFSGKWLNTFDGGFKDDFYSSRGSRSMKMMSRLGAYKYWMSNDLDAQIVEIPYEGLQCAMIIVLPTSKKGLPGLLRSLKHSPDRLNRALEKMKRASVLLAMPVFKIEADLNLNPLFKKIGLKSIFSSKRSGLTGIVDDEIVFVSKGIHKAVIEVNEEGTVASGATGITALETSAYISPNSIEFTANHPFYFIIRMYQEQLFTGIFNG